MNIEAIEVECDRLGAYLRGSALEKCGAPEHRKALLSHRLLTDLIDRNGGTADERAYVARRLAEIEAA